VLFVGPHLHLGGLHASIRGHEIELSDPRLGHALAPTPDDLLVASLAAHIAWVAQARVASGAGGTVELAARCRSDREAGSPVGVEIRVIVRGVAESDRVRLLEELRETLPTPWRHESVSLAVDSGL
jgi:hypothetical protein